MKKLFLVLALLILTNHGAFAACDSNTDKFNVRGWCIDTNGKLTPKALLSNGVATVYQGSVAVPVNNYTSANTPWSLDTKESGTIINDTGGVTSDTLSGFGSKFTLPRAVAGLTYTLTVGSKSSSTLDTLDSADTFLYSISGTGFQMGDSMKSTGQAGDSVTVTCTVAGKWSIQQMHSVWTNNGNN